MSSDIVERLYAAIEHGDAQHRQWLKDKLVEFFAAEPPASRDEVVEEVAVRVDEYGKGLVPDLRNAAIWIADAIRALKSSPPQGGE